MFGNAGADFVWGVVINDGAIADPRLFQKKLLRRQDMRQVRSGHAGQLALAYPGLGIARTRGNDHGIGRNRLDGFRRGFASNLDLHARLIELKLQRSEEHTSELQSLMRISYAVFCLKKKTRNYNTLQTMHQASIHIPE